MRGDGVAAQRIDGGGRHEPWLRQLQLAGSGLEHRVAELAKTGAQRRFGTFGFTVVVQSDSNDEMMTEGRGGKVQKKLGGKKNTAPQIAMAKGNNSMLGQVVGIIIGSPEFQRR